VDPATIIALGIEVAGVFNKLLAQLPDRDQKVVDEFYKFIDMYTTEIARADADHDDLIMWKDRKELLLDTVIKGIKK